MKIGKLILMLAIATGSGAAYAAAAPGNETTHGHEASDAAKHEGYGVVKDVNATDGKVKIAHQPIGALGWPAMTMWFRLHAPLPPETKAGDSVRFELRQQGKEWVITRIERGK